MNTRRYIRTIILILALFMGAAIEALADDVTASSIANSIIIESSAGGATEVKMDNGTPVIEHITTGENQGWKVTITITPDGSHHFDIGNINVQKLANPNQAQSRRRTPSIADALSVSGPETVTSNNSGDYIFTIPEGYAGALVTVTFTINDVSPDYSGIYYLQSKGDATYYMVPSATENENGKLCVQTDKNQELKAVWKLEKVAPNSYHIIHYSDGKYMIADVASPTNTVWLEETASPADNAIFEITENETNSDYYNIKPKGAADADYLNVSGGNGSTHTLGLGTVNNDNSLWKLIDKVPVAPTISVTGIKASFTNVFGSGNIHYTYGHTTSIPDPTNTDPSGTSVTLKYGPVYYVKAVCIYHDNKSNTDWTSDVVISKKIQVGLLNPAFSRTGNNVTISNSQKSGVKFLYTFSDSGDAPDPVAPNGDGTGGNGGRYSNPLPLTANSRNVFKAIAYNTVDGTTYSSDVVMFVVDLRTSMPISSLSAIAENLGGNYKLTSDVDASGFTSLGEFTGTLDGDNHVIANLSVPLFTSTNDAIIRNLTIEKPDIKIETNNTNVGAITQEAKGNTRIYNCGLRPDNEGNNGSIEGTKYVGGLVGWLKDYSRVINCYSYADITGGTHKGGIVGYNDYASTSVDLRTMVMNCMFYGDITTGGTISPIYGGQKITNRGDRNGLNNFNYFRYQSNYSKNGNITSGKYNCALGAEDNYLVRFEFHRNILNSNRELAAWYAIGDVSKGKGEGEACEMAKWVLDKSIAPYPILKKQGYYPSVINYDANKGTQPENKGGTLGTLTVNIQMDSSTDTKVPFHHPGTAADNNEAEITTSQLILNITDKDFDNYNFNYRKVQLPYYDMVGTKNCTGNRVVTGWKIVSVSGDGTEEEGSFTTGLSDIDDDGNTPYNFADRTTYAKDLYSESKRVFSQGAYFNVPKGVTSITIEPYWAKAAYLSDPNYDLTYNTGRTSYQVTNMGTRYSNGGVASINGDDQVVYTALSGTTSAIAGLASNKNHTVYDYAVVLVGNFHGYYENSSPTGDIQTPLTIMSSDFNKDGEPDYTFFIQHGTNRLQVAPLRYDFINLPGIGLAQKADELKRSPCMGIYWNNGWFEVTNTAILRMEQMEFNDHKDQDAPLILLGGIYDQIVSFQDAGAGKWHTPYIHVGDNAWFALFNNGCSANRSFTTPHVPISVTGGEFEKFYLSGYFRPEATPADDNAECYIDGGKFEELASGGMEQIKGDVTWKIYNADITNFYGGGINAVKPVLGNIDVLIENSRVNMYCGGPKFGDMDTGKTVETNATDCVFDSFYGAGYGGTSLLRVREVEVDDANASSVTDNQWNSYVTGNYKREYVSGKGISTSYYLEYIQRSGGQGNRKVGRLYVDYASLSLATTRSVTSTLTGCTINYNFYGGGHLGKVSGNTISTLHNCTVYGSVFGAGFSGEPPTVEVMPIETANPNPYYNEEAGVFRSQDDIGYPTAVSYTWKHTEDPAITVGSEFDEDGGNYILTTADLTTLGTVEGQVTLNITGNTFVEGKIINEDGTVDNTKTGGVFGGGDSSGVKGNTEVNVNAPSTQTVGGYNANIVYGGGNKAAVSGNTTVNLYNGVINGDVFGGGNNGVVNGSATVNIQDPPTSGNSGSGSGSGGESGGGSGN